MSDNILTFWVTKDRQREKDIHLYHDRDNFILLLEFLSEIHINSNTVWSYCIGKHDKETANVPI